MRILALSDNHYKNIDLDLNEFDYVLHCGDYGDYKFNDNIIYVRGNCDLKGEKIKEIVINNKKILITHGDLFDVKYTLNRLFYKALDSKCDICIYGHTHYQQVEEIEGIYFINPGAYKDGYYAIINDNNIELYYLNKKIKEVKMR